MRPAAPTDRRPESTLETVTYHAPGTGPAEPTPEPAAEAVAAEPVAAEPVAAEPVEPVEPVAPIATEPAPEPVAAEAAPTVIDLDHPPLRVLVVEDNPFDLATIETLLEPFSATDISLVHAATRAEGQRRALTGEFDVVLLDLDLPDSTGVTTVLEWQHAVPVAIPLITTTAEAGADLIHQARALGVVHVVAKPHLDGLADKGEAGSHQLMKLLRSTASRKALPAPTTSF